jgi:diketogulonate reductase-like aldo/keto reductase
VLGRREFVLGMGALALGSRARRAAADAHPPAMAPLIERPIPATGEKLPVVGLGTWQTFDVGRAPADRTAQRDVLSAFVLGGGKLVDSSPMYGESERVVGDLVQAAGLRPRVFVATKVWTRGEAAGIRQMETSLGLLHADPIDLMQVHNLLDVATHLKTLRRWKEQGKVRYIGVTHYQVGAFDELARILRTEPVDFVQLNYSIQIRDAERSLLPLAAERRVAVIVNRPFEGGSLFQRTRGKPLPPWATELGCTSWSQYFLKYVIAHPAVTCVIPATDKVAHLQDNLAAGSGALPDEATRRRMALLLDR